MNLRFALAAGVILGLVGTAPAAEPPWKRLLSGGDAERVAALEKKSEEASAAGAFPEAVRAAEEALGLRRRLQGDDHWQAVDAREWLRHVRRLQSLAPAEREELKAAADSFRQAKALWGQRKRAEAEELHRKALDVRRRVLGVEDQDTVTSLNYMAFCCHRQGRYAEALAYEREALDVQRRVLGEDHPETAGCYNGVAFNLSELGRYDEAQPLYEKALAIRLAVRGEDHEETARGYNNLAASLSDQGKKAEAEGLYRKALVITRRVAGENARATAIAYNNVGADLIEQGRAAEAEPFFRKALAVRLRVLGAEDIETAESYNDLATVLDDQGEYADAELLHRKALDIRRLASGPRHRDAGLGCERLAKNLTLQGRHAEAEPLLREALGIMRQALGNDHDGTAFTCGNLAACLDRLGKLDEAETLHREEVAICTRLNRRHPFTGRAQERLASNLLSQGRLAEAEEAARAALHVRLASLGERHPDSVDSLVMVATVLHARGDDAGAEDAAGRAAEAFRAVRQAIGYGGLERSAFDAEHSPLPLLSALRARRGRAAEAWASLEAGLGAALLDDLTRPLGEDERRREQLLLWTLRRLDEQVARTLTPDPGQPPEAVEKLAAELRRKQEAAQEELAKFRQEMTDRHGVAAGQTYDLARIQGRLDPTAALLAWVDVDAGPGAADARGDHWACLVRAAGEPRWVRLPGTGPDGAWTAEDARLPQGLVRDLAQPPAAGERGDRGPAARLAAQRLGPVAPLLGAADGLPPVRHLIVLPSVAMAGVPVETLVEAWEGRPATPTVSYAPSGTFLTWLREKPPPAGPQSLLAVADPELRPRPDGQGSPDLSADAVARVQRGRGYAPLPFGRREVAAVAGLFPRSRTLLGREASEPALDELARGGGLGQFTHLHLATHGEADARSAQRSALILTDVDLPDPAEELLADREPYTGRLTAERIRRTWRLDAELVTLSACESGLGRLSGGEGYLGFAQALFLAGSRSLVLSLWKVDDQATALLMVRFYQNLLGARPGLARPLPRAAALAEAKRWLRGLTLAEARRLVRELGQEAGGDPPGQAAGLRPYEHPHFWAGFILVGDPGDVSVPLPEDAPGGGGAWWLAAAGALVGGAGALMAWRWRGRRRGF